MVRRGKIFLLLCLILGVTVSANSQQASFPSLSSLLSLYFNVVGVKLKVSPEYQAVPKGIATQVTTGFESPNFDVSEIAGMLPKDYTVRAELTGPAFQPP